MAMTLDPIANPVAGKTFPVSGSYDSAAPGVQYKDDSGAWVAISAAGGTTQGKVLFSYMHPPLPVGTHKISVQYPGTTLTATATVTVKAVFDPRFNPSFD